MCGWGGGCGAEGQDYLNDGTNACVHDEQKSLKGMKQTRVAASPAEFMHGWVLWLISSEPAAGPATSLTEFNTLRLY